MKIESVNQLFIPVKAKTLVPEESKTQSDKLQQSAKDLEGVFLTFVLKAMEKTIPRESSSNNLQTMMFSSVLGQGLADQGGVGLAEFFHKSMSPEDANRINDLKNKVDTPTYTNINTMGVNDD